MPRRRARQFVRILEHDTGREISVGVWPCYKFKRGALIHARQQLWRVVRAKDGVVRVVPNG